MALSVSHRPVREFPLLILAGLLVAGICVPLQQWLMQNPLQEIGLGPKWTHDRLRRLFVGPEQIACYSCFVWASLILMSRWREVWRQRRAFDLDLLPTDEGARILPEDARPLSRKLDQATARRGPFILGHMVRLALGKYAVSRSAPDVGEVVRMQAEVEQGRLVTSMGTVQYLVWAIPAIGFLGTVRGLAGSMSLSVSDSQSNSVFYDEVTRHLSVAFDCTFIALTLSVLLMYLLHVVQRAEELLVIDCQQYCQEHLLLRLYDPHPEPALQGE